MTNVEVRISGAISKRRMVELLNALVPVASDKMNIEVVFNTSAKIMIINHKEDTS